MGQPVNLEKLNFKRHSNDNKFLQKRSATFH